MRDWQSIEKQNAIGMKKIDMKKVAMFIFLISQV